MKHCSKCDAWQERIVFTKNRKNSDGLNSWCKYCTRKNSINGYIKYRQKRTEQIRKYRQTDRGKVVVRKAVHKWIKNNPKKFLAHQSILSMARLGLITAKPCEVCGIKKVHAHHDDYDRPYEVRWLCPQHHKDRHSRVCKST